MDNSCEPCRVAPVKTPLIIRIPSAVIDPRAQVMGFSGHFIDRELRLVLFPFEQGSPQLGAKLLVSRQDKDPFVCRTRRCKIPLLFITGPGAIKNRSAILPCNFLGPILASAVHNHNLVGHIANGIEGARQTLLFVECNCADGQADHKLRSTRAGFPATITPAGTSLVTTLPAPTMEFSPIVTLLKMVAPDPMEAPCFTTVFSTFQSAS